MHIFDQLKTSKSDFSQKTGFDDRVAIIAIYKEHGVAQRILAEMFGLSRTTVSKICSFNNKEYQDEKREYKRLGPIRAYQMYVTNGIRNRLNEAMK